MNVASPFNYLGGKFKLLSQIQPLLKDKEVFLDLFSGGGSVGINALSSKVIFNDSNEKLIGLIEFIRGSDTEHLLVQVKNYIEKYSLSDTSTNSYSYYGCTNDKGLAPYNKRGFLKLREDFNKKVSSGEIDYLMLYVLIVFSFNNQIRFNSKGLFNLPVGKRDFNRKMQNKLKLFSDRLKSMNIQLMSKDFRAIELNNFVPQDTIIYCDPPYLITDATYGGNSAWTETDELDLLEFLDKANELGFSFALSNVLESKGTTNTILCKWLTNSGYSCYPLKSDHSNSNYQRKNRNSITKEVLITNYKIL